MPVARSLTMSEIEEVAEDFKQDLTREMERVARRQSSSLALEVYSLTMAKEHVDSFVRTLALKSSSQIHTLFEKRTRGRKPIHINDKTREYAGRRR